MGLFIYTSYTPLPHLLLEAVPGNAELRLLSNTLFSTLFFNLKWNKQESAIQLSKRFKKIFRAIHKSLFHIKSFIVFSPKNGMISNILVTLPIKIEVVISKKHSSKIRICRAAGKTLQKKNKGDSYSIFSQFEYYLSFAVLPFEKAYRCSYTEIVRAVIQFSYRERPNMLTSLDDKWERERLDNLISHEIREKDRLWKLFIDKCSAK